MKIYKLILLLPLVLLNSCQEELSTSPEEVLLTKNALIVGSNPSGAKIFINGKNTGQFTPDTLFWLQPGPLKLTLKLNLFRDTSIIIQKGTADTQSVFLDYTKNPTMSGKLFIDSHPRDADIFINDSSINKKTPYEVRNIFPGQYTIKLKKSGYWDEYKTTTVYSTFTTHIDPYMTDTTVWITYNTARTGIPSNYLTSVAIESNSTKWIGTLDAGLASYDDNKWIIYNTGNSLLPDNYIRYIHIDMNDVKWVCTNAGLIKIDGNNWSLFSTGNSGIPDDRVTSVSFDGIQLWVGTEKGIGIYDGQNWRLLTRENSILPANIVNYLWYNEMYMYVCTSNGLLRISQFATDTSYAVMNTSNSVMPNNNVRAVNIDKSYNLWLGCGKSGDIPGGTAQKINRDWFSYPGKPDENVYCITVDRSNTKWFGSSENGLSKYLNGVFTYYTTQNSKIPSDRIFRVVIDKSGNKWMSSLDGGLIKYKGN
jgi:ligand-binding sensor domain-containing protein